jgi:hypothetical protein
MLSREQPYARVRLTQRRTGPARQDIYQPNTQKDRRHGMKFVKENLLDGTLCAISIASVAALFLAHDDPFVRDEFCSHLRICPAIANAKAWNKIVYDLAVGALVSVLLYFLVVRVPEYQKRQRIKRSLTKQYRNFREDCIAIMLMVSDGTFVWGFHEELIDQAKFRKYFEEKVSPSQDRWDAFQNKLDQYNLEGLITKIEILRDEITFALNNVEISEEPFVFLKRLSNTLFSMRYTTLGYDETKRLAGFLWSVFAGWDNVYGYLGRDNISDTIAAI